MPDLDPDCPICAALERIDPAHHQTSDGALPDGFEVIALPRMPSHMGDLLDMLNAMAAPLPRRTRRRLAAEARKRRP